MIFIPSIQNRVSSIEYQVSSIQNQVSRIEYPLFGVDVCPGVRRNGKLDEHKLKSFFANVRTI